MPRPKYTYQKVLSVKKYRMILELIALRNPFIDFSGISYCICSKTKETDSTDYIKMIRKEIEKEKSGYYLQNVGVFTKSDKFTSESNLYDYLSTLKGKNHGLISKIKKRDIKGCPSKRGYTYDLTEKALILMKRDAIAHSLMQVDTLQSLVKIHDFIFKERYKSPEIRAYKIQSKKIKKK